GYLLFDIDHRVWNVVPNGEIGDLCSWEPQSFQRLVGTYMVQRVWSNASAKAGHDPCVPTLTDPYFNSVPMLNEDVFFELFKPPTIKIKGVRIPVGQTKVIDVQLFSDAPTSDWNVTARLPSFVPADELSFQWDAQTGNNGTILHLAITRNAV